MTGNMITLGQARSRLKKIHAEEMKHALVVVEEVVRQIAEANGISVEQARTLMAPKIADQIATMNEMHRLAQIDLEVLAEGKRDHLDK